MQIAFSIGCLLALGACFWFYIQDVEGKTIVYVPAVMMGSGGSIMLVTSLSLLAELIGQDKVTQWLSRRMGLLLSHRAFCKRGYHISVKSN